MPFQSTPPHGRRLSDGSYPNHRLLCFNPRLHMGGDLIIYASFLLVLDVSIHASTWEATILLSIIILMITFQSTPPHGRRLRNCAELFYDRTFQSTPPHGRRLMQYRLTEILSVFQSTPPHGRRRQLLRLIDAVIVFQSTPPHGRRRQHLGHSQECLPDIGLT